MDVCIFTTRPCLVTHPQPLFLLYVHFVLPISATAQADVTVPIIQHSLNILHPTTPTMTATHTEHAAESPFLTQSSAPLHLEEYSDEPLREEVSDGLQIFR